MEHLVAQQDNGRPGAAAEAAHWAAFIGAPSIWFVYLNTAYALVPVACSHGAVWAIWAVTVVAAAGAAACGLIGLRRPWRASADPERIERARFMNRCGTAVSALFTALILVQGLASVVFSPCEGWALHW